MSTGTYDNLWTESWGDQQTHGPVHRHQRRELVQLISSLAPTSVLDVGCGAGDNLAAISRAIPGIPLSGTDVSQEALTIAARRVPAAMFYQMDVQKEKLPQQFDLILCNQVIEHLIDDISALKNIAQMTRRWALVATMRGRMRPSELKIGHYRNYSDVELRAKAQVANLDVVDIFGWGFPFYSPLYRTAIEWIPNETTHGKYGTLQRTVAGFLFQLYRLNIPRHGDVVTMLARPSSLLNQTT